MRISLKLLHRNEHQTTGFEEIKMELIQSKDLLVFNKKLSIR
jgi:hypothetical protein